MCADWGDEFDEGADRILEFGAVKLLLKEYPEIGIGGTIWEGVRNKYSRFTK